MNIIELNNVNKFYTRSQNPIKKLGAAVFGPERSADRFCALSDICFSAEPGECVGIIGRNGSGKSTLLRILAGISAADSGSVKINGTVSAMLEPGIGFNPEYSGMKNIYLSGALNGFDRNEIKSGAPKIMEFAEIPREFQNMPIKTYSSGMLMRLGFSVMLWQDSDIILADEALGVGDIRFRAKCYQKFESLKEQGKTIIFVTHDPDAVRRFCTRAVWLDRGRVRGDGDVARVTSEYMEFCVQPSEGADAREPQSVNRYGTAPGSITDIKAAAAAEVGGRCEIEISVNAPENADLGRAGVAVSIKDRYGLDLCVFRTEKPLKRGENKIRFEFENRLAPGEYAIAVGFENRGTNPISYYEYIEGAAEFKSTTPVGAEIFGLVSLPSDITIN